MAEQSIAVPRKRDGTEMSVTGAALKGRSVNEEVNLNATQVSEPAGQKLKKGRRYEGYDELVCGRCRKQSSQGSDGTHMASDSDLKKNVWLTAWTML